MTVAPGAPSEMAAATALGSLLLGAYQEGSIVSRTLLTRSGGTVTFFAFDAGQGLSEHTAPFDAIAHILEGEAEITIAGRAVRAAAGELVRLPANQPHALHARARFKMLLTMLRHA